MTECLWLYFKTITDLNIPIAGQYMIYSPRVLKIINTRESRKFTLVKQCEKMKDYVAQRLFHLKHNASIRIFFKVNP
jgi:FKBP-type peptidyl-prolyl cis-trans isomerase 2